MTELASTTHAPAERPAGPLRGGSWRLTALLLHAASVGRVGRSDGQRSEPGLFGRTPLLLAVTGFSTWRWKRGRRREARRRRATAIAAG